MRVSLYLLFFLLTVVVACKKDKDEKRKEPLTVKGFLPVSGNSGTVVTIRGTGFERKPEDNKVTFGGTPADVMATTDTSLMVLAPQGGATGPVEVTVGERKVSHGTYTYQRLSVQSIYPENGPAGANVQIRGEGFTSINDPAAVTINGKPAVLVHAEDTLLIVSVPVASGSGIVHVTIDHMEADGPFFTFQGIESIKPLSGGAGTRVTVHGEGFDTDPAKNTVAFNGKTATMISATATELVVEAPAEAASGPVTVTVNEQKTVGPVFTIVPHPTIVTVVPLSGPAGVDVTINGNTFSENVDENKVVFNGVTATIKTASAKQLVVTIPAGAGKGPLTVTVNDQPVTGPEFTEQALGILTLSPDNAFEAGTEITITGTGFSSNPAEDHVTFNGVPAMVTQATFTELKVMIPVGFSTGPVNVSSNGLFAQGPEFRLAGVSTVMGGPGTSDFLAFVTAMAVDSKGDLYTSDGNRILKLSTTGTKSVFAGDPNGTPGMADGNAADALFNNIGAMVFDAADNLYVADNFNGIFRKITPAGVVSTLASKQVTVTMMVINSTGRIIYSGGMNTGIYRLESNGSTTQLLDLFPDALALDAQDNLYVALPGFYAPDIRKYTKAGNGYSSNPIPFAGDQSGYGFVDGIGAQAQFTGIPGMTFDKHSGYFYVVDNANHAVRRISLDGEVKTITGSADTFIPTPGYQNGSLSTALFEYPNRIVADREGNLFVLDNGLITVRKVRLR